MSYPLPISVAIIARNEEKNLKRLLPNIRDFAEEIVLVYNDCEDETVKVAQEYDVCCYEEAWRGYKEQKNLALLKCSKEWILCLDADEVLSDQLKDSIQKFFSRENLESYNGASCNRCSFFMGRWIRHGDWYPDKKIRMIRRTNGRWVGGDLHEFLECRELIAKLDGDLLHYSYESILDFPRKTILYSQTFSKTYNVSHRYYNSFFIISRSLWRFIRSYILRFGFLDGFAGYVVALSAAFECMIKHGLIIEKGKTIESLKQ